MCAMIYKHRPSSTALAAAGVVLIGGTLLACGFQQQDRLGDNVPPSVLLTGCVTIVLTGALVIVAFARYKFTHLWKKPPSASKKPKKPSRRR